MMTNPLTTYRRAEAAYRQWAHVKRAPVHCVFCFLVRSIVMEISK